MICFCLQPKYFKLLMIKASKVWPDLSQNVKYLWPEEVYQTAIHWDITIHKKHMFWWILLELHASYWFRIAGYLNKLQSKRFSLFLWWLFWFTYEVDFHQVGKNYVCSEWKQELITFSQFLERMWSSDCPSNLTYLAQHPLFEQVVNLSLLFCK